MGTNLASRTDVMGPQSIRLTFRARASEVGCFVEEIAKWLPSGHQSPELLVGVSEALSNAIIHGALGVSSDSRARGDIETYLDGIEQAEARYGDVRRIEVEIDLAPDPPVLSIHDPGSGFDWRHQPPGNGRGLEILKSVFANVRWNDAGNSIHLTLRSS